MNAYEKLTLVNTLAHYLDAKYTGSITCDGANSILEVWFVRGQVVHACADSSVTGWDALYGARDLVQLVIGSESGALPPQRSIRLSTTRLLEALTHVQVATARDLMNVPLPFHERLQHKFLEVQKRVNGLKSFESHEEALSATPSDQDALQSGPAADATPPSERIIVEVSPRGAKWLHQAHGQELSISGDNNVTTSDLMWAGEELRKEFNRLSKESPEDE